MNPKDIPMFYGATPITFEKAAILRKKTTKAEQFLWEQLKNKQLNNSKFRRQHPINIFIADFYCHTAKLVIEIDGEIHNREENKDWDSGRTEEMERFGLKVIRFTNHQVLNDLSSVLIEIRKYL
ncbi:MAG: endonuclease domain-containing protein [Bacteroidales bacterium]